MDNMTTKEYAVQLRERLVALDDQTSRAYYEMGQILSAVEHGKLWDILGYSSFTDMIESELSFTPSTAYKYLHTYRGFRRLGYNKSDALSLINQFSFTRMAEYLPQAKRKCGTRAIATSLSEIYDDKHQFNVTLNKREYAFVESVLLAYGAIRMPSGRGGGIACAFLDAIKQAAKNAPPRLKAVG